MLKASITSFFVSSSFRKVFNCEDSDISNAYWVILVFPLIIPQTLKQDLYRLTDVPVCDLFPCVSPVRTGTAVCRLASALAGAATNIIFVAAIFLSQQAYFCRDKRRVLWQQRRVCCDKNGTCGSSRQ